MANKVLRRHRPEYVPKGFRSPVLINPTTGEAENAFTVRPPGWEQFIKIDPILGTTEEEKKKRRKELAMRISSSPTPEVVRGIASIMTTIDDYQDGFVTAAVAGRVLVKFFPRLLPFVSPFALAADALNLVGALANVVGVRSLVKCLLHGAVARSPNTYRRRLEKMIRTGKLHVGWGEVFQILQTSANLVDVGIEIGAGLGYAYDLAFGLIRGADIVIPTKSRVDERFVQAAVIQAANLSQGRWSMETLEAMAGATPSLRFKTQGVLGAVDSVLGNPYGTADVAIQRGWNTITEAMVGFLQAGSEFAPTMDIFTWEQHASIVTSFHQASDWLRPVGQQLAYQPIVDAVYSDFDIEPRAVEDLELRSLIRYHGQNPDDPRFALPGSPGRMPYREFAVAQREAWARAWPVWSAKAPSNEAAWFGLFVLDEIPTLQAQALESDDLEWERRWTPETRALLEVVDLAPEILAGRTTDQNLGGLARVSGVLESLGVAHLDPEETVRLFLGEGAG